MKERFDNKYFNIALMIFGIIAASIVLFFTIYRWSYIVSWILNLFNILTPILYGLLIAYILTPMIKYLEKKLFDPLSKKWVKDQQKAQKLSRFMSLFTAIILLITLIFCFIYFVIPQIIGSIDTLIKNLPDYFNNIKAYLSNKLADNPELKDVIMNNINNIYNSIIQNVNNSTVPNMDTIIVNISNGIMGIIKTIINFVIGIIVAIYLLNGKENFISQAKKMMYSLIPTEKGNVVLENIRYVHKIFGGFLLGQFIDAMIVGVICFIFMYIFKMPFAVLIAVIIGITNVIPYFGPYLGAVPSALLILIISPAKCITFIIFIFILQQFDGNILCPKILGEKTGLKSFWVLFSILIFGGLFGFVGMLFGVPLFAVIYAFINGICMNHLEKKGLPKNTNDYANVKYINPQSKKPIYFK